MTSMVSTPFNQKCPITFEQRLDQSFVKGNKLQGGESSGAAWISPRDLVKIGEVCQDLGSFLTRVVNTEGALSVRLLKQSLGAPDVLTGIWTKEQRQARAFLYGLGRNPNNAMAGSRPRCCRVNSPPRREGNLLHSLQQQLVPLGALSGMCECFGYLFCTIRKAQGELYSMHVESDSFSPEQFRYTRRTGMPRAN